jgi:hypothetical protein
MTSTFSNENKTLTIEVLQEAIKKLDQTKRPFFMYSTFCPIDKVIKSKKLDQEAERFMSSFNSKFHELLIIHPKWKEYLEKRFKGLYDD